MIELILEVNRRLYPPLPVAAMVLFVVANFATWRYPTSSTLPMVAQRSDLAAEVRAWPLDRHETAVRWLDYAALSKREIIAAVGERSWFYRGQDMYAEGWPLHFARDEGVAGVLEAEEAHRAELQERTAVPGDDIAPPVPTPPAVHQLGNAVVLFGAVTGLPLLLLLIPATRENLVAVLVLGAVALLGAGPFAVAVSRTRRAVREHREAAHRDRALRLYLEGTPERELVADLRVAVPDRHGVHRLDGSRYPALDRDRVAAVARSCGWEVLGREDGAVVYLGRG